MKLEVEPLTPARRPDMEAIVNARGRALVRG